MYTKTFRIVMDLRKVLEKIRHFDLDMYDAEMPLIFVEAKNPDDACFIAYCGLFKIMLDQDSSIKTKILCKQCKEDIIITQVGVA